MTDGAGATTALEFVKMTVAPENEDAFLRDRPAAIEALRRAFPGLREAWLFRGEEPGVWYDVLFWDSIQSARTAAAGAAALPEAAAWFAHIGELITMEHGTLAHELGHSAEA